MAEETPIGGYTMYGAAQFLCASEDAETVAFFREMELAGAKAIALGTLQDLWHQVVLRAVVGTVMIRAVKAGADTASDLSPDLLLDAHPDFTQSTIKINGCHYHTVRVFLSTDRPHAAPGLQAETPQKNQGGAHSKMPDAFIQEVVRRALTPDGIASRAEIKRHMEIWFSQQMGDQTPSTKSIDRYLDRVLPPELPRQ